MGIEAAIIGSAIGGISGRKSAKERRASIEQDRTDRMEGYNFSKPYIQRSYDRAEGALNDSLEQGAYQGQTYADQNPYFQAGNHYMGGMGAMGGQGAFDVCSKAKVLLTITLTFTNKAVQTVCRKLRIMLLQTAVVW